MLRTNAGWKTRKTIRIGTEMATDIAMMSPQWVGSVPATWDRPTVTGRTSTDRVTMSGPEETAPDRQETEDRRRGEGGFDQQQGDRPIDPNAAGPIDPRRLKELARKAEEERVEEVDEKRAGDERQDLDDIGVHDLELGGDQEQRDRHRLKRNNEKRDDEPEEESPSLERNQG